MVLVSWPQIALLSNFSASFFEGQCPNGSSPSAEASPVPDCAQNALPWVCIGSL